MVCFMTYSVYSLNFSSLFPQQSQYLMMITLYFLLSICWTLISMAWFLSCNSLISKAEMPKLLYNFAGMLQRASFRCFLPRKPADKTDKKNNAVKKSENQESSTATGTQKTGSDWPPTLTPLGLQKHNKVESIDINQFHPAEDIASDKSNTTDVRPNETIVSVNMNETNEKTKPNCNFCHRCTSCQTDFDKDKTKSKNKKDIEGRCNALNNFVFLCVFILMFISNLAIWLVMAN